MIRFKKIKSTIFIITICFFAIVINGKAWSANRYLVASGDWNSTSCWSETSGGPSGASYPVAADIVYIERGYTITVTQDAYCNTLNIGQVNIDPGNIIVNTGVKLSYTQVTGMTVNYTPRDGSNSVSCSISGGGSFFITNLTIGSTSITPSGIQYTTLVSTIADMKISGNLNLISDYDGNSSNQNIPRFYINEGVVAITGNIAPSVASVAGDVYFRMDQGNHTGTLKLEAGTPWSSDMDFKTPWGSGFTSTYYVYLNAVGATVEYSGAAQTVRPLTYNNLTLSGSGVKTLTATPTVNGTLSMQGTATCTNSPTFGATSTLEYKGTGSQTTTSSEFLTGASAPLNLIIDNPNGVTLHVARTLRTSSANTLTLKSGKLTNTTTNNITLSNNSTITRIGGSINAIPVVGTNININYAQHTAAIGTGPELPLTSTTYLNNLTIDNSKGVTLAANANPKGATIVNGTLICGTNVIGGTGSFALNDGAVLKTGNATGINGTITTIGTITYNSGASYSFNGTVAQVTGSNFSSSVKNLTIENTHTSGVTLTNNVSVSGLASVTKILNCADKIISGTGAFTLASGATIITANTDGITSSEISGSIQVTNTRTFNTNSNFTYNGTSAQITGTGLSNINKLTISNSAGVTLSALTSSPAICGSLLINSGAIFTIGVNNAITVTGLTTLSSAECLVIKSTSAGTGSLIDNGFTGSGTARIERWVSNNGSQRWEYVSSPITNASSTVFTSSIHGIRYADEPTNSWVRISHTSPQTMGVYKGYTRSYQNSGDGENSAAVFIGTPNTGTLSPTVTFTADAPGTGHGWNLLGNPYTSAIDWYAESGWTKDNINDAIYFRKNGVVCTFVGGFGTNDASNIIPPMQAFWVRVTDANGGSIQSDNSVRVHSDVKVYKRGEKTTKNTLHIKIVSNLNSYQDDAYICFRETATSNFDSKFDAFKMYADDVAYPQIFSISGNDSLAINCLDTLNGERTIKLGFKNLTSGTYTITAELVSSFTNNGNFVYLEDSKTGTVQDLSLKNTFEITAGARGGNDSIILHFNSSPLPIQLLSFKPTCMNGFVEINWSTASETNNDFFTIERSEDASNWEFVKKIQGSGNSTNIQNYSINDEKTSSGVLYYRLRQTDFDGKTKVYNAVAVNCFSFDDNSSVLYYPNPFESDILIQFKNNSNKNSKLSIYNVLGTKVYSKEISNDDLNFYTYTINLSELAKGIYTIELQSDSFTSVQKIVKK
jgi:hypothetical protein